MAEAPTFTYLNECVSDAIVFAGKESERGFSNGFPHEARFDSPCGMCWDKEGNLLVADHGNFRIRKIDRKGNVLTIAGSKHSPLNVCINSSGKLLYTTVQGVYGEGFDIPLNNAFGIASYKDKTYVTSSEDDIIREIVDGKLIIKYRNQISGTMCVEGEDNLWIADTKSSVVAKISNVTGKIEVSGKKNNSAIIDGNFEDAGFNLPNSVAADIFGDIYVVDHNWKYSMEEFTNISTTFLRKFSGGSVTTLLTLSRKVADFPALPAGIAIDTEFIYLSVGHSIYRIRNKLPIRFSREIYRKLPFPIRQEILTILRISAGKSENLFRHLPKEMLYTIFQFLIA
jgi:hypothetical protein